MTRTWEYLIGVDGGGTNTRLSVSDANGNELVRASGGPSALGQGIAPAWAAILDTLHTAFRKLGKEVPPYDRCSIGMGLSGVHNAQWAKAFLEQDPGFGVLALDNDAYTTLLGAHAGEPGVIVALGTGSVGEALLPDGKRIEAGGWGFPSGDEASGAWLGLSAAQLTQKREDGRLPPSPLTDAVFAYCGGSRDALFAWLGNANQHTYAQLAPLVIRHAEDDEYARQLLRRAGEEVRLLADALDPTGTLPLALCGGLAEPLRAWLPNGLSQRACPPRFDAVTGARILVQRKIDEQQG